MPQKYKDFFLDEPQLVISVIKSKGLKQKISQINNNLCNLELSCDNIDHNDKEIVKANIKPNIEKIMDTSRPKRQKHIPQKFKNFVLDD